MKRLVTIVEGYGEVRAVPVLTYRWLRQRGLVGEFFVPDLAINTKGCGNLKAPYDPRTHRGIEHYVLRAMRARPDVETPGYPRSPSGLQPRPDARGGERRWSKDLRAESPPTQ